MGWLAAFLLLPGPQDDKAAEKLLAGFRQKVRAAKTVRVEYSFEVVSGGAVRESLKGALLLKGDSLWRNDLEFTSNRRSQETVRASLVSDGRKVAPLLPGPKMGFQELTPAQGAAQLREAVDTGFLPVYFLAHPQFGGRGRAREYLAAPTLGPAKDGGTERVGDREVRVVTTEATYPSGVLGRDKVAVKLLIDPATLGLLRREITIGGGALNETFAAFAVDEEIPDSEFSIQSAKRLARARAEQAARAVELYARFTGRSPASFEDLARRPAALEPEVFYPAGGFLAAAPKDPWGRPFALRQEGAKVVVSSLGADGKPGGRGDDEDIAVAAAGGNRQAVGAPTERLRQHFEARVRVQLLAAALRGFVWAYGELPAKKAALWEKPDWAAVWPEGGWLAAAKLPDDPWGEPYRIISEAESVRVQVQDPKARLIGLKQLTPEERKALEEAAKPRLSAEERKEIARLIEDLGQDDLEARERAVERLKAFSLAAVETLEARMKKEPDAEVKARLGEIRRSIKIPRAAWMGELGALTVTVTASEGGPSLPGQATANERNASASLKTVATAQADFRANDRDGNRVQDFWTGDIAGLYCITTGNAPGAQTNKLIELSVAAADGAPLNTPTLDGAYPKGIESYAVPGPKGGYHFRSMTHDNSGAAPEAYGIRCPSRFGACAYPADYPASGTLTYILNEGNTMFAKDTEGEPVLEWPSDAELRNGWRKLD